MCNHAGRECATYWVLQLYSKLSCALASDMPALTSMAPTHRNVIGRNDKQIRTLTLSESARKEGLKKPTHTQYSSNSLKSKIQPFHLDMHGPLHS